MSDPAEIRDVTVVEAAPELPATTADPYQGIGTLVLSGEQTARLAAPIPPDDLDIKPDGSVYCSQVRYRRILNEVFGPGRWALMPRGQWVRQDSTICREYALIVDGRFIAQSVGEQDYIANNPNMTWATATEGAKSNALVRCCKDLGIASECWDHRFCERFKAEHCVQVWVEGKQRPLWRRKDVAPFYKERGPVRDRDPKEQVTKTPPPAALTITAKERQAIFVQGHSHGHDDDSIKAWLRATYSVDHTADILKKDYPAIIARMADATPLEAREPGSDDDLPPDAGVVIED